MKTLNIELTVRRMEAQNILTTSISQDPTTKQWAPSRTNFSGTSIHSGL